VPTAIVAFVGRAYRGPVDEPVRVQNWGDFERRLGGLRLGYLASATPSTTSSATAAARRWSCACSSPRSRKKNP
jgi:hypothetical protein